MLALGPVECGLPGYIVACVCLFALAPLFGEWWGTRAGYGDNGLGKIGTCWGLMHLKDASQI
jgi:hypothetical protein